MGGDDSKTFQVHPSPPFRGGLQRSDTSIGVRPDSVNVIVETTLSRYVVPETEISWTSLGRHVGRGTPTEGFSRTIPPYSNGTSLSRGLDGQDRVVSGVSSSPSVGAEGPKSGTTDAGPKTPTRYDQSPETRVGRPYE